MKYFFVNYFFLYKLKTSADVYRCSSKLVTFRNDHRKTPVLEPLSNKVAHLKASSFIKERLQHRCFQVNIAKILITAFFIKHLRWLLLNKGKVNLQNTWFILLHWIQNIVQNYKDTETETRKTKTLKDRKLALPKE